MPSKQINFTPTRVILVLIGMSLSLYACGTPAQQPTATPDPQVIKGQALFKADCATCHALEPDTVIVGPSLAGVATHAESRVPGTDAKTYLTLSIMRPGDFLVPGFADVMQKDLGKKLTGDELDAIVAFLLTLK